MFRCGTPFVWVAVLGLILVSVQPLAAPSVERIAPASGLADTPTGLFHEKCGACHETARALLPAHLTVTEGVLVTARDGADLRVFLRNHFGARDQVEIDVIYASLLRISQGGGRFKDRCGICHESARAVARRYLILRDGRLVGRYSGLYIEEFLHRHGTRGPREVDFFRSVLERHTADRP